MEILIFIAFAVVFTLVWWVFSCIYKALVFSCVMIWDVAGICLRSCYIYLWELLCVFVLGAGMIQCFKQQWINLIFIAFFSCIFVLTFVMFGRRRRKVMRYLREIGAATATELHLMVGGSANAISGYLKGLSDWGIIKEVRLNNITPLYIYRGVCPDEDGGRGLVKHQINL